MEEENCLRRSYCQLLLEAGKRLKMVQTGVATATVLCHRYFACKSMRQNDCFIIACASLFLGGKIEETPKALTDILRVVSSVRFAGQPRELEAVMAMQDELRERVLAAERAIMYALEFNMGILHPYKIALSLVNERGFRLKMHTPLRNNLYDLPQIIFNVTNISLQTQLSLQYRAEQIAVAVVHLAMMMLRSEAPLWDGRHWWQHCNVSAAELEDMVFQILNVLDKSSRQVDYSGFGPRLPELPSGDAVHIKQYQSPDDAAPGSSTHLMLTEGTLASESGLNDAQPAHGSDKGGSLAQQTGFESTTSIERTQESPTASA
ncbi:Cyclin-T1-4 [Coccomyxa sp. Obi]|nr:Cyclin-T1-4 [Coccomyxa sp. Obi]